MKSNTIRKALDYLDLFKAPIPSFNIGGRTSVPSLIGGICSFLVMMLVLMYSALKFKQLTNRTNPNISRFLERDAIDSTTKFNLLDVGFHFAFGVEGFLDREMKNDPRYVKLLVRFVQNVNGKPVDKVLPFHKCTAKDWAKFAPPSTDSVDLLNKFKTEPDRYLFCIDWEKIAPEIEI